MSDQNQLELFEEEKSIPYLQVILNGQVRQMSLEELFDTSIYTELKAVSFVASHRFFFKTTKRFQSIQLILGIEDGHVAGSFAKGLEGLLDRGNRMDYFQSLQKEVQPEIESTQFQIRYSKKGTPIHSKIYLLDGPKGNRVMIGSANFTETALGNQKQYEELLVFDNHGLFEIYQKRFDSIFKETVDFIPEKIKSKNLLEPVNIADPEVLLDVLLDEREKNRIMVELTEAEVEKIQQSTNKLEEQKEATKQFINLIEVISKINHKTDKRELLPIKALRKKTVTIKSKLSRTNKKSTEVDQRQQLIYYSASESLFTPAPKTEDEVKNSLIPFSKKIEDPNLLKKELELIGKFIEAYQLFTVENDSKVQSRIAEAILYAFVSAHVWRMRDHYANEEGQENIRRHLSPFLIIAGRSMSGKTTALEFISRLLGNVNRYMSYEQINGKNMMSDFFHSSNVSPLLVDEIDATFFQSKAGDKGERLIKDITSNLAGPHPVLIGTTNATGFDAKPQSSSRLYYLQINATFHSQKVMESGNYLSDLMNQTNPSLYKDFTFRLSEKIRRGEEFYSTMDLLSGAREIFKEYYLECNMEIPGWFPHKKFNDYQERGKQLWQELYKSHPDSFEFRKENTVLVHTEDFTDTNRRNRDIIMNFLPQGCITEDSYILLLNQKIFKEYIEYDKYFKKSLFRSLFKEKH